MSQPGNQIQNKTKKELYDEEKRRSLIDIYRHVCMMLHMQNTEVANYLSFVRKSKNIIAYKEGNKDVTNKICDLLLNC